MTAYDASYLDLAHRRGIPLASLDGDLKKAARAIGVAFTRRRKGPPAHELSGPVMAPVPVRPTARCRTGCDPRSDRTGEARPGPAWVPADRPGGPADARRAGNI